MISGLFNVPTTPEIHIICLWRHHDTSTNSRRIPNYLNVYYYHYHYKSQKVGIQNWEKTGPNKSVDMYMVSYGDLSDDFRFIIYENMKIFRKVDLIGRVGG